MMKKDKYKERESIMGCANGKFGNIEGKMEETRRADAG